MADTSKIWLVRTRSGIVQGPYTQRELWEAFQARSFQIEDEICPAQGRWISAQSLDHHEEDELTHTSTRNQTVTRSTNSSPAAAIKFESIELDSELTPTPTPTPTDDLAPKNVRNVSFRRVQVQVTPPANPSLILRSLMGAIFLIGVWVAVVQWKRSSTTTKIPVTVSTKDYLPYQEGDSSFVRTIYNLIRAGETSVALKQLSSYHEKNGGKGNLEYLIPYSALLIIENESPARAKKYLEQVLTSNAPARLKSRAHHWIGYLLLSSEEGDMGESHFLEALELSPKDPSTLFNLGRAYLKGERYKNALDYLQLTESEVPDLWLVHIYKGRARAAFNQNEEATASFRTAVELAPDRWLAYMYYAVFLTQNERVGEAQAILKQMITRDPTYEIQSPPPFGFFQEKINYSEYLTSFTHVMEKAAGEEKELGRLYLGYLLSPKDEIRRLEAVAEKGGLLSKILALKASLDRDASMEEVRRSMKRLPNNLSGFGYFPYVLRGEARMRLGMTAEAAQDLSRALELGPTSAIARWAHINYLKKTGKTEEAKSELNLLLQQHPNYTPAILMHLGF